MADHSSTRVVVAALIGNALIAVTKFVASAMTGSAAMFSEAIHSVVDSGNQVLLHGIRRARRPATPEHPFGHGREVYFWAFVVAILIFGIGAGLSLYEGWQALHNPHPPTNPWVNFIVLGVAFVFEGAAWWVAFREFRRSMAGRSVEFADDLTAPEVEDTVCALEGRIRQQFPQVRRVFVEAESLRERRDRPLPPPRQARAG